MEQDSFLRFEAAFRRLAATLALPIPDSCVPQFYQYLCALKKWNEAINLTSLSDDEEMIAKHFIDSVAGIKAIDKADEINVLDVGAGAGFPGLPLKLVLPDLALELLEPNQKKGAFLRYVAGSLGLQRVTVVSAKLEPYATRVNHPLFDYVVVRALKVDKSGQVLASLLKPAGKVLLYRAEPVSRDLELSGLALAQEVEYELPSNYGHRVISVFSKVPSEGDVPRGTSESRPSVLRG